MWCALANGIETERDAVPAPSSGLEAATPAQRMASRLNQLVEKEHSRPISRLGTDATDLISLADKANPTVARQLPDLATQQQALDAAIRSNDLIQRLHATRSLGHGIEL